MNYKLFLLPKSTKIKRRNLQVVIRVSGFDVVQYNWTLHTTFAGENVEHWGVYYQCWEEINHVMIRMYCILCDLSYLNAAFMIISIPQWIHYEVVAESLFKKKISVLPGHLDDWRVHNIQALCEPTQHWFRLYLNQSWLVISRILWH